MDVALGEGDFDAVVVEGVVDGFLGAGGEGVVGFDGGVEDDGEVDLLSPKLSKRTSIGKDGSTMSRPILSLVISGWRASRMTWRAFSKSVP